MRKIGFLQLTASIVICLLIFGAVPVMAADAEGFEQTYTIADYYNEDGSFSELGLALEVVNTEKVLTVNEGDVVVAGERHFRVLAESFIFSFYTQPSLTHVIDWWTVYLVSLEEGGVVVEIEGSEVHLIGAEADAYVTKLNGNQNDLYITVIETYSDGSANEVEMMFKIKNNSAGTYAVGGYCVYVDTKGNDQIRACYIVE